MASNKRWFHVPLLVSPKNPSICTIQVAQAPLSLVGAPGPDGQPMPKTMKGVQIELWEADRGLPDGGDEDDLLATLVVDLALAKDGTIRVTETDLRLQPAPKGHIVLGYLEVRLELAPGKDGPVHRIPVHAEEKEWPHNRPGWAKPRATTELAVTIKSDYPDESTREQVNLLQKGFEPSGPVAAFICLEGSDGIALGLARRYWEQHADLLMVTGEGGFDGSLKDIASVLSKRAPDNGEPFQEVNIIAHGTEDGMYLHHPGNDRIAAGFYSHDATVIDEILAASKLEFGTSISNEHTRIVIRGCTIGRDRRLLETLSKAFAGARVHAAADRVLYLYEPAGGYPEYYLLQRYFTPVPGAVAGTYRKSAKRTAQALSNDPHHGSGKDFETWAKRTEGDWGGVLPRYFRKARELDWLYDYGDFKNMAEGRTAFEKDVWGPIRSGADVDGRYRLATYEQTVDPDSMSWNVDSLATWAGQHNWRFSERFGKGIYTAMLHRTHVVVEVLITDPPDDPLKGTPVPLDLQRHFVSAQV